MRKIKILIFLSFIFLFFGCKSKNFIVSFYFPDGVIEKEYQNLKDFIPLSKEFPGYKFEGWFFDQELKEPFTLKQNLNYKFSLYPKYSKTSAEKTHFKITFKVEGYEDKVVELHKNKYIKPQELVEYTLNEGEYLVKWFYDAKFTKPLLDETFPFFDLTLFGKLEYDKNVIFYYHPEDNTKTYVKKYFKAYEIMHFEAPEYGLYPLNYEFEGWYLDKERTKPLNVSVEVVENLPLYAKYIKLRKINIIDQKEGNIKVFYAKNAKDLEKKIQNKYYFKDLLYYGNSLFLDSGFTSHFNLYEKEIEDNLTLFILLEDAVKIKLFDESKNKFVGTFFKTVKNKMIYDESYFRWWLKRNRVKAKTFKIKEGSVYKEITLENLFDIGYIPKEGEASNIFKVDTVLYF